MNTSVSRFLSSLCALVAISAPLSASGIPACSSSSGSLAAPCSEACDKQEACGDIDSVKAEQCRKKCAADADVLDAALDACINKSDILSATSECLSRACSDYASCLTTIPACKGTGTGTGTDTGTGTGIDTGTGTDTDTGTGTDTGISCHACACVLTSSSSPAGCADICDNTKNGTTTPNFCNGVSALPQCAACIAGRCGVDDPTQCD